MNNNKSELKQCSICGEVKYLNEFYSQKKHSEERGNWIYYNPECKECTKKKSKKWKIENRDKANRMNREYEARNIYRVRENKKILNEKYRQDGRYKEWQLNNKGKINEYRIKREQHKKHDITIKEWNACKQYFNYECAYCGLHISEHYNPYAKELKWTDFHKEHVDHNGANDLSNCVPACKSCNGQKWEFELEEWYSEENILYEHFSQEKLNKIYKWLNEDYKLYISK